MKITTLIFDLGNVLLTNDWHFDDAWLKEFNDYFGITPENNEKAWDAHWPDFKTGKITEDEFWRRFFKTAQAKKMDIEHGKKLWKKYQHPIEDMFHLLKKLKQNYRLAGLTTISREWLNYKREKFKLDDYFELIISSGYAGVAKPDPKIYDIIIKKLDVYPKECIFIDDLEYTLPPAQALGINTILFTGQTDLERKLKKEFKLNFKIHLNE